MSRDDRRLIIGVYHQRAGYSARGPVNTPVRIFSFADFERQFGGLDASSDLSYAVSHFFLNGGKTAWIVRVAAGAAGAAIDLENEAGGAGSVVLTVSATSAGAWGNALRVSVDHECSNPASLFNLQVAEVAERNGRVQTLRSEMHRNLSMNSFAPNFAPDVVNATSDLVRLERPAGLALAANGVATSGNLTDAGQTHVVQIVARRVTLAASGTPA